MSLTFACSFAFCLVNVAKLEYAQVSRIVEKKIAHVELLTNKYSVEAFIQSVCTDT